MTEKTRKKEAKEEKELPSKKEERKNGKICFVIAPIDKPDSETRKRSDQVFNHIISPVVVPMGYRPVRADHISEPGLITSQIIQHVVDSPLVVADLTGRNPNVFYELAIRHAIRKPLVQFIRTGEQIPFDVAGTRTINIDVNDLDSADQAKKELAKQIESIEKGKIEVDTPISVALDLKILRESENPEQRSLADVVGALSELRTAVIGIEKKVSNPESLLPPDYFNMCVRRMGGMQSEAWIRTRMLTREIAHVATMIREDKKLTPKDKEEMVNRLQQLAHRIDMYMHEIERA
jgi:hypothetical protein